MKAIIITEGGKNIGFGHITRCIAIYQGFEKKGLSSAMIIKGDDSIKFLLKKINYSIVNWLRETQRAIDIIKAADIVVIDSYLANLEFYKQVSNLIKIPLFIDDYKRIDYPRGLVVNSAIYANEINYPKNDRVRCLLGPKYVPLRKEFRDFYRKKIRKDIKNVLITFGGMRRLKLISEITSYLKGKFNFSFNCIYGEDGRVSASEIRNAMLEADFCISGGGQTIHELAKCGVPTLGICFAENQLTSLRKWEKLGFLKFLGWYDDRNLLKKIQEASIKLNFRKRMRMSQIGKKYIDGHGVDRIVEKILSLKRDS